MSADMHTPDSFKGVWTALVTPMTADLAVDWPSYERLLIEQEKAGVTGVVVSGTTGESATLAVHEKLAMVRKARAILGKRVRIMAGTGDNNTQQSVELSKLAQDAGADSLLIVTPPYNKPSLAGLLGHYRAISEAVRIPVCLYHVPSRTAHHLSVDQLVALCDLPGVACVKEASADLAYFSRAKMRTKVPFLVGDDSIYLGTLAVGGFGIISVVSNVFPAAVVALQKAFESGDMPRALALHEALLPAVDALFCEVNPCPAKAALSMRGLGANAMRPPLAPITQASHDRVREALETATRELGRLLA